MGLSIRVAKRSDLAIISDLARELNIIHHKARPDIYADVALNKGADKSHWMGFLETDNHVVFIAQYDALPIGFIAANISIPTSPLLKPVPGCRIGSICVLEAHRGQGVGKVLMNRVREWALARNAQELRLAVWHFNKAAIRLYEEFGFEVRALEMGMPITS
ncbi:GNAT family N-acetyltransferase [Rahnella aquatilis]|uniref:GNAT family N-acetyltransferase n=1 Tax=Rahnella aquatilis TaxID=34038 RepID=UPI0036683261